MKDFELKLLELWKRNHVKEIYRYKHRIFFFRTPLPNIELFYDMDMNMFKDVEDIACYSDSCPADYKKSVDNLIQNRQ